MSAGNREAMNTQDTGMLPPAMEEYADKALRGVLRTWPDAEQDEGSDIVTKCVQCIKEQLLALAPQMAQTQAGSSVYRQVLHKALQTTLKSLRHMASKKATGDNASSLGGTCVCVSLSLSMSSSL